MTDPAAIEHLVASTLARHGRIDILGNIAGINDYFLAAHEVDDATWDRVLAVNTTAVMRLCRAGPARDAGPGGRGHRQHRLDRRPRRRRLGPGLHRLQARGGRHDPFDRLDVPVRRHPLQRDLPGGVPHEHRLPRRPAQRLGLRPTAEVPRPGRPDGRRRRDRHARLVAGQRGGVQPERGDHHRRRRLDRRLTLSQGWRSAAP